MLQGVFHRGTLRTLCAPSLHPGYQIGYQNREIGDLTGSIRPKSTKLATKITKTVAFLVASVS